MTQHAETSDLPVLPLRDVVVFPHMVIPLFVGRDKSIRALDQAMESDKRILLVAQKSADTDAPGAKDLHEIGTLAQVLQLLKLPDGTIKVLVEGLSRSRVTDVEERDGAGEAFDEHLDGAVGQLQQLQHLGERADLVQVLRAGRVGVGGLLGDQQDALVALHRLVERADGLVATDKQGDDHVREHHDVAQRQHRQVEGVGMLGHGNSGWGWGQAGVIRRPAARPSVEPNAAERVADARTGACIRNPHTP